MEDMRNQIHILKDVPRLFSNVKSDEIGKPVSIEETDFIVNKMPKEKSPCLDGWTQEIFISFFDIMGKDLLRVVEESKVSGFISGALNVTFFALIPKVRKPSSFNEFRPIALCNFAYKVISKTIATCIKNKMASCISQE
jgi:hypothetical protein